MCTYEFLFHIYMYAQKEKKSHPKFSFIYIRKRANLWFSTMHVFLICFPPLSGSPLSPYFLFRLSWNIFTSWKFNHYLPPLWATIHITSKRGKLSFFCHNRESSNNTNSSSTNSHYAFYYLEPKNFLQHKFY